LLNPTFGTLLLWQGSFILSGVEECRNVMKGDEINEDLCEYKNLV
jgi:hypothetical protein